MLAAINKNHLIKIIILLSVFIIFIASAINLIDISIGGKTIISINSEFFNSSTIYDYSTLSKVIYSLEFILLFLSGMMLVILLPILSPIKAITTIILVASVVLIYGYINDNAAYIPMEYNLLTLFLIYIVNVLVSYFFEIQSKQKLLESFSQYIPPHLVSELSKQSKNISLTGEARNLTVFFCDLQNFTSISEELNPKQLNSLLNEYFTVMTEILFKYNGTIDKYIGDAIMAFWNAPTIQTNHEQLAIEAALEMDKAIRELSKTFINRGWPGPTMGIGINTGRANVGNMGSTYRMTYTAIGDSVNLASRIETLTREYRVPILISEHTLKKLNDITYREIDKVRVKGKHQRTRIYQPLCKNKDVDSQLKEKLLLHHEALELYYAEKYRNASRLFRDLYENDKNDKYYKSMIIKIQDKRTTQAQA